MNNVVHINELPHMLSGNEIFSFLDLKSIAILKRALASFTMQRTFRSLIKLLPAIQMNIKLPKEMKKLCWFKQRQCRVAQATVYLHAMETELAYVEIDLIDKIDLFVSESTTLDQNLQIPESFCTKISRVISGECDGVVMKMLLVRLMSIRNLHHIFLRCAIEAWFADMLRELHKAGSVDIEHINLQTLEHFTDRTMYAIAECCPKLLLFQSINSFGGSDAHFPRNSIRASPASYRALLPAMDPYT